MLPEETGGREYRGLMEPEGLDCYRVTLAESDLYVCSRGRLQEKAFGLLAEARGQLEGFIANNPPFETSFKPVQVPDDAPHVVREMDRSARLFNVGPMAAVAGAVSQYVGEGLIPDSPEVVVENGGDIFVAGKGSVRRIRLLAGGGSPSVDVAVRDRPEGIGVCTSSGAVGHSVSLGRADAVTVIADSAAVADAAATAFANLVRTQEDIESALAKAASSKAVRGVVVLVGGSLGAWGDVELL
jgi:uncharacterized protein